MKGYFTLLKASEQEPHHHIQFSVVPGTPPPFLRSRCGPISLQGIQPMYSKCCWQSDLLYIWQWEVYFQCPSSLQVRCDSLYWVAWYQWQGMISDLTYTTGLNSEFAFSLTSGLTKAKDLSHPYYLLLGAPFIWPCATSKPYYLLIMMTENLMVLCLA